MVSRIQVMYTHIPSLNEYHNYIETKLSSITLTEFVALSATVSVKDKSNVLFSNC